MALMQPIDVIAIFFVVDIVFWNLVVSEQVEAQHDAADLSAATALAHAHLPGQALRCRVARGKIAASVFEHSLTASQARACHWLQASASPFNPC
jgi:hypothetical protein